MKSVATKPVTIEVAETTRVSGLWQLPSAAWSCLVFSPGAGSGMQHPFMAEMAAELNLRGVATLRYQFPYMERGSKRVDAPALCHATVRAAVREAASLAPALPSFAGGKSFGGRMTSQAEAIKPLQNVRGLAFLGFPLHPPKMPSVERADHLFAIRIPMLFLQGTHDEFAELSLLRPLVERLGPRATISLFDAANHAFHAPKRTGISDAEIRTELAQAIAAWMKAVLSDSQANC